MTFLAAIPLVGGFFEKLGQAIDQNVTTDHERLKVKAQLLELQTPLIVAIIDAQRHVGDLQVKIAEIEVKAEDRLVRWRRPLIALAAAGNFLLAPVTGHMDVELAFYFAAIANGLDMTTRGVEKIVKTLKGKEHT